MRVSSQQLFVEGPLNYCEVLKRRDAMREDTNVEKKDQEPKAAELSQQDLDKVVGGTISWSGSDGDEALKVVRPTDSASPNLF
jgi:hypothetical protein